MITLGQWRRAMGAGVIFVVLLVVGVMISLSNSPDIKKKDTQATAAAKYVTYLSDSGHRAGIIVGAYLIVLAALAYIWFAQALRTSVTSTSFSGRAIAGLATFAGGGVAVGAVLYASPAGSYSFGDEPLPAGDTARVVMDVFVPCLLLVFGLATALILAIMAVGLRRAGTFPSWVSYTAWLGVLGGIFAVEFLPILLPLLWFLVFAIVGLVRPPSALVVSRQQPVAATTAPLDDRA